MYKLTLRIDDSIVQVGDRYYVKAIAILSDGDSAIATTAYAREAENKKGMDVAQITGASSSYARKYALNGLLAIDDTKDADTKANSSKSSGRSATSKQIGLIQVLADKELGYSNLLLSKLTTKHYSKGKLPDLTVEEASDFIEKLQGEIDKQDNENEDIDPEEISSALEGYNG